MTVDTERARLLSVLEARAESLEAARVSHDDLVQLLAYERHAHAYWKDRWSERRWRVVDLEMERFSFALLVGLALLVAAVEAIALAVRR